MGLLSKIFPVSVPLPRPPVPEGKTRVCVSGFGLSHHTGRARFIAESIGEAHPDKYETWFYFDTRGFRPGFLDSVKEEIKASGGSLPENHTSSPFCWIERTSSNGKKEMRGLGGRDKLCEWAKANFDPKDSKNTKFLSVCDEEPPRSYDLTFFDNKTPGTANTSA